MRVACGNRSEPDFERRNAYGKNKRREIGNDFTPKKGHRLQSFCDLPYLYIGQRADVEVWRFSFMRIGLAVPVAAFAGSFYTLKTPHFYASARHRQSVLAGNRDIVPDLQILFFASVHRFRIFGYSTFPVGFSACIPEPCLFVDLRRCPLRSAFYTQGRLPFFYLSRTSRVSSVLLSRTE